MTPKQRKALQALLTCPTKRAAAAAAGIDEKTLRRYLSDDGFRLEYEKAVSGLVENAATQAKQSLSPALLCLREIVEDDGADANARINAARAILSHGMKLIEVADILDRLTELEAAIGGGHGH